jgi:hypothetical protein
MRESHAAVQAFQDYLAMPPAERSLERLSHRYRTAAEAAPTKRLGTLKSWSVNFAWQTRIAGLAAQERESAEARVLEERNEVLGTGLALAYERVRVLKLLAGREAVIVRRTLARIAADPEGQRGRLLSRYQIMKVSLDHSLKAIAEETGGRARPVSVTRDLVDYAKQLAYEKGFDVDEAVALAKKIARGEP